MPIRLVIEHYKSYAGDTFFNARSRWSHVATSDTFSISTSIARVTVDRVPLSVRRPTAASASFCVYGPSFMSLTLL